MTNNKEKEFLCKGCFTEWIIKKGDCETCKEIEKRINRSDQFGQRI